MAITIEDPEVETLASEVAGLAHETKTEAIKQALLQRRVLLQAQCAQPVGNHAGRKNLKEFMEKEIWPLLPASELGRPPLTRQEKAVLLGYGPEED